MIFDIRESIPLSIIFGEVEGVVSNKCSCRSACNSFIVFLGVKENWWSTPFRNLEFAPNIGGSGARLMQC